MNTVPFFAKTETPPARAPRPQPGSGVRVTVNEIGVGYAVSQPSPNYRHPWKAALGAGVVTFRPGLVNVFTPKIAGKPMTDPKARLELDPAKVNAAGESFAVVEVEPNAEGILDAQSRIEIVQLAEVNFHEEKIGRLPLALLVFRQRSAVRAFSLTMFHVKYQRGQPAPGGGLVRHLFL